jgi:hypothetical protein
MIGLIHRDAGLGKLLAGWLDSIEPEVITIELSSYGVAFRKSRGEELSGRLMATVQDLRDQGHCIDGKALDTLRAYIALPLEFVIASDFAARRGIPLHLVDLDSYSRSYLDHMEALLDRENLVKLLCCPGQEEASSEMAAARLFFEKGLSLFSYTEEMLTRDRHMRDRIGELMDSHGKGRFLHICGWQHLKDPGGLYAPLNPHKVFVYDKALRV